MSNHARLFLLTLTLSIVSSAAQAFDGYCHSFPWFGYGNNGPAAYALGNIPAPPYFALHPPVYYSRPVPRTYGRSPFACSCNCHDARIAVAVPRAVSNPFVPPAPSTGGTPAKRSTPTTVAAVPVRIVNPFYAATSTEQKVAQNLD